VSSSCLHNLRDFPRIRAIYHDIRTHLKPGGVFLNLDLVNAPTLTLRQHYDRVAAAHRQRDGALSTGVDAMLQRTRQTSAHAAVQSFPANLAEHLEALRAAGFAEVDCFWKDLRRALYGGYV